MATLLSQQLTKPLSSNQKTADFRGYFVCFPVIKPTLSDMFFTLWEILTFTSSITSESFFHCQSCVFVCFVKCLLGKKRTQFSPFSLLQSSSVKTFHRQQGHSALALLNSRFWEAAWEAKQSADTGNKVKRKKQNWQENSKLRKLKTWCHAQPVVSVNPVGSRFRRAQHCFWEHCWALAEPAKARSKRCSCCPPSTLPAWYPYWQQPWQAALW